MSELTLRTPRDNDWPAILDLAERSLGEMPNAPGQEEWLHNRRSFSPSDGIQKHFVAISDGRIVGYACAERRNNHAEGECRLFVVVAPSKRRTLGTYLFAKLRECLIALDAPLAWVLEFEEDAGFISYLEEIGFQRLKNYKLYDKYSGVVLTMKAPFRSLAQPDSTSD